MRRVVSVVDRTWRNISTFSSSLGSTLLLIENCCDPLYLWDISRPPSPKPIRFGPRGRAPQLPWCPLFPLRPMKAHWPPRGVPVTPRYSGIYPVSPETFSMSDITFQYINLYVSTILRLLLMSMISSRTPNNIRSQNDITHIIQIVIER